MAASPGVMDEGADLFAQRDEGGIAAHGGGIFALERSGCTKSRL